MDALARRVRTILDERPAQRQPEPHAPEPGAGEPGVTEPILQQAQRKPEPDA
jgi:hypothetical protein